MNSASLSLIIYQDKNNQSNRHVQATDKSKASTDRHLIARLCFCIVQARYELHIGEVIQMYPDKPNEVRTALYELTGGSNHQRVRNVANRLLSEFDQCQNS